MKIASILCPTDHSDPSRHATEYAAAIARWTGARIVQLHVRAPALETVPHSAGYTTASPPGMEVVYDESPAEAIAQFARGAQSDLIVIGTHGATGFRRLILGSVTETVLRHVECPVLTVPPRAQSTARLPFEHMLAAVDFTSSSLAALEVGCALAADCHAVIDVLHVIDDPDEHALFVARPYDVHHHPDVYKQRIAERLQRVLLPAGCDPSRLQYRITRGAAEHEILQNASEARADLIVMGVGRSKAPVFGSTVNYVIRHATSPVLTVRREGFLR